MEDAVNESRIGVSERTPAPWMNAMMRGLLRTPGVQRLLGKQLALLTFTGRRSGVRRTIPVSYARHGDEVTILTKRFRSWWMNFAERPEVEVRLAGKTFAGTAEAVIDDEGSVATLTSFLENRPVDAKAFGVRLGPDKRPEESDVRALVPHVVVVRVRLD